MTVVLSHCVLYLTVIVRIIVSFLILFQKYSVTLPIILAGSPTTLVSRMLYGIGIVECQPFIFSLFHI